MIRFYALLTFALMTLLLAIAGIAGAYASIALLTGAVSLFGLSVALCKGSLSHH